MDREGGRSAELRAIELSWSLEGAFFSSLPSSVIYVKWIPRPETALEGEGVPGPRLTIMRTHTLLLLYHIMRYGPELRVAGADSAVGR